MGKRIKETDKAFVQGLFYAAGFMADTHGELSYARDIIEEAGYAFRDGRRHGVDPSDLERVGLAFGRKRRAPAGGQSPGSEAP